MVDRVKVTVFDGVSSDVVCDVSGKNLVVKLRNPTTNQETTLSYPDVPVVFLTTYLYKKYRRKGDERWESFAVFQNLYDGRCHLIPWGEATKKPMTVKIVVNTDAATGKILDVDVEVQQESN
jgi:hypothetical protein